MYTEVINTSMSASSAWTDYSILSMYELLLNSQNLFKRNEVYVLIINFMHVVYNQTKKRMSKVY